jgi:hypothetical protein
MSDINLDFTVSNNSIDFTVESNDITFTPSDIQLTVFPGGAAAGGSTGMLQYNNNGFFGGVPQANYDGSNLTFQVTSTKITGGNNHYYLQTDGTGNLTWSIGTGNMQGNGTVAGANTQIQYNADGMNFGGNAGFTFEAPSGNVNIPGNLIVVGNIIGGNITSNYANYAGNVVIAAQPNITSLGTLVNLTVAGILTAGNANLGNTATANYFIGSGNNLSNIQGANVSGIVANANYASFANVANTANLATFATTANSVAGANVSGQVANALVAGTVYTNAQPNITSLGTLTSLSVTGTTSIQQAIEKMTTVGTGATGTITYNLLNQSILYYTANASGNFSLNFIGNGSTTLNSVLSSNQSMTSTFINTNGITGYYLTSVQIDGFTRTVKWVAPTPPNSGTILGSDVYTFNILKTASNTYTILGSRVGYL